MLVAFFFLAWVDKEHCIPLGVGETFTHKHLSLCAIQFNVYTSQGLSGRYTTVCHYHFQFLWKDSFRFLLAALGVRQGMLLMNWIVSNYMYVILWFGRTSNDTLFFFKELLCHNLLFLFLHMLILCYCA